MKKAISLPLLCCCCCWLKPICRNGKITVYSLPMGHQRTHKKVFLQWLDEVRKLFTTVIFFSIYCWVLFSLSFASIFIAIWWDIKLTKLLSLWLFWSSTKLKLAVCLTRCPVKLKLIGCAYLVFYSEKRRIMHCPDLLFSCAQNYFFCSVNSRQN